MPPHAGHACGSRSWRSPGPELWVTLKRDPKRETLKRNPKRGTLERNPKGVEDTAEGLVV